MAHCRRSLDEKLFTRDLQLALEKSAANNELKSPNCGASKTSSLGEQLGMSQSSLNTIIFFLVLVSSKTSQVTILPMNYRARVNSVYSIQFN